MIDLKALLALLVVGQLSLSTAGRRHHSRHGRVTATNDTRDDGDDAIRVIKEYTIPHLRRYVNVEEDVEKIKSLLIHLRDVPVPEGKLPITNRRSHEVGQYVLIVTNTIAKIVAGQKERNHFIRPETLLEKSFGESMRKYADDYKIKLQPAIDAITHIQDVLEPILKAVADLSKETDPSQQLAIYLKYELENKPNDTNFINLLFYVFNILEDLNSGPVSEEDVLVEQGAGRFVLLNVQNTASIAEDAIRVDEADPTKHTSRSYY